MKHHNSEDSTFLICRSRDRWSVLIAFGVIVLCLLSFLVSQSLFAQSSPTQSPAGTNQALPDLPFELDVTHLKASVLKVPAGGKIRLNLVRIDLNNLGTPNQVAIDVTTFQSEGKLLTVQLSAVEQQQPQPSQPSLVPQPSAPGPSTHLDLPTPGMISTFELRVPAILDDKPYSGILTMTATGHKPKIISLSIGRADPSRPATLVLDQQNLKADITKKDRGTDGAVTVGIREKDGVWPLTCLLVTLEAVTETPESGFDREHNVTATLDGKPLRSNCQSVPAGSVGQLQLAFRDLVAGKYALTFRIRAEDANFDGQTLQLALRIRHHVALAVLALILGGLVSFVGTAAVSIYKERADLLNRIAGLQPMWFTEWKENRPFLAVVKADAFLRQAEELTRSLWLKAPDAITTRINEASTIISLLDRIRQLYDKFTEKGFPEDVSNRAERELDRIARRIGQEDLTETKKTEVEEQLRGLESWLQDGSKLGYWKNLSAAADQLLERVDSSVIIDPTNRSDFEQVVQRLRGGVEDVRQKLQTQPVGSVPLKEMMKVEEPLAYVRILWDRLANSKENEFADLISALKGGTTRSNFIEIADSQIYISLKAAHRVNKVRIEAPPANGPDPLESLQPLAFTVDPGDKFLRESFLFKKGLSYNWDIQLQYSGNRLERFLHQLRGRNDRLSIPAKSNSPCVLTSAPWPGSLSVAVNIKREDKIDINIPLTDEHQNPSNLPIRESRQVSRLRRLLGIEAITSLITLLVSLISGLSIYYYTDAFVFGSFKDYLGLFTWAAGVDQTKNFAQTLAGYRK